MNNFNDREKAFEKKFANDQEAEFKISAKRNKLLGTWVASILNLNEEQKKNYITEVIKSDFQEAGDEDVFKKIKKDLEGKNIQDTEIRQKMSEFLEAAKKKYKYKCIYIQNFKVLIKIFQFVLLDVENLFPCFCRNTINYKKLK
jgi:hypothetical protein